MAGSQGRGRPANEASQLLSNDDNNALFQLIGNRCCVSDNLVSRSYFLILFSQFFANNCLKLETSLHFYDYFTTDCQIWWGTLKWFIDFKAALDRLLIRLCPLRWSALYMCSVQFSLRGDLLHWLKPTSLPPLGGGVEKFGFWWHDPHTGCSKFSGCE